MALDKEILIPKFPVILEVIILKHRGETLKKVRILGME